MITTTTKDGKVDETPEGDETPPDLRKGKKKVPVETETVAHVALDQSSKALREAELARKDAAAARANGPAPIVQQNEKPAEKKTGFFAEVDAFFADVDKDDDDGEKKAEEKDELEGDD